MNEVMDLFEGGAIACVACSLLGVGGLSLGLDPYSIMLGLGAAGAALYAIAPGEMK